MATEKVKVMGVKFFRGSIDDKAIDSGKIYIEEALDFTRKTAKGYASQEYALGNAEAAELLMKHEFPLMAEVEFMRVTNGDVSKNVVMSVKPIDVPRKAA